MTDAPDIDAEGLFVAGTGTGVGKTVVTAGLTGWFREAGVDAVAVKPAQTGFPPDDDAGEVQTACESSRAATCLRRLEPPLAPRVAADRTETDLAYDRIREDCRAELNDAELGIVEGIGGLRVPLADDAEVLDLVEDLGLPTVLVARSGLGTLNHTALSVDALEKRGVPVRAVLLNEYDGATVAERTNPDELRRMLDPPVVTVPTLSLEHPSDAIDGLRSAVPEDVLTPE